MEQGHYLSGNGYAYFTNGQQVGTAGTSNDPRNSYQNVSYGTVHANAAVHNGGHFVQPGYTTMPMQGHMGQSVEQIHLPMASYPSIINPHNPNDTRQMRTVREGTSHTQSHPISSSGPHRVSNSAIGHSAGPSDHMRSNAAWSQLQTIQTTSPQTPVRQSPSPRGSNSLVNANDALAFARASFPVGTPDYARKQAEMYEVLMSAWKQNNMFEPSPETLLRFATKENGFWMCALYVDGHRCQRSLTDRQRQIIEHIRRHIKLEPFVCEGSPCPASSNGCGRRYSSGDPLRKHRDGNLRGESICERCGRVLLPGNIIRHQTTSCREGGQ